MQIANNFRQLLSLLLLVSVSLQCISAGIAKKPLARKKVRPAPVFKAAVPTADPSAPYELAPFKVSLSHTDIAYPPKTSQLFHRDAKADLLKASIGKTVLSGTVTSEVAGPSVVSTVEHGVKSHFLSTALALVPKLAPTLAFQLETQLADARKKLAGQVAQSEKQLQAELNASRPQVLQGNLAPSDDAKKKLAGQVNDSGKKLNAELQSAKAPLALIPQVPKLPLSPDSKDRLDSALAQAKAVSAAGSAQGMAGMAAQLQGKKTVGFPNPSSTSIQFPEFLTNLVPKFPEAKAKLAPEKQMDKLLTAAKLMPAPNLDVDAKLRAADKDTDAKVAFAKPKLDAILTNLRVNAKMQLPTASPVISEQGTAQLMARQQEILWDAWHAGFAKLAGDPLLKAIKNCKNPSGDNTVTITVSKNHHVEVALSRKSNAEFDQAVLAAYKSLDGNSALEYPPGSQRTTVSFEIDNKHANQSTPAGVTSQTSVGDKEVHSFRH